MHKLKPNNLINSINNIAHNLIIILLKHTILIQPQFNHLFYYDKFKLL